MTAIVLCIGYTGSLFSVLTVIYRPKGLSTLEDLLDYDGIISGTGLFFTTQVKASSEGSRGAKLKALIEK